LALEKLHSNFIKNMFANLAGNATRGFLAKKKVDFQIELLIIEWQRLPLLPKKKCFKNRIIFNFNNSKKNDKNVFKLENIS